MLLVFGGSLGASHVNEAISRLKSACLPIPGSTWCTPRARSSTTTLCPRSTLRMASASAGQVVPYISNMGEALAAADLVVSRAGASSIAEIAALAVPSVLVPYPLATGDHQTTNAHYLVDAGAANLFADDTIDGDEFARDLLSTWNNGESASAYARARGLGQGPGGSQVGRRRGARRRAIDAPAESVVACRRGPRRVVHRLE